MNKATLVQLRRFANAFREAKERAANESDTVLFLCKFFEDVLGYDSLKGEIAKELAVNTRFCDVALKIDGAVRVLVEAKAAGQISLSDRHIEQAENYASRSGLRWVLLTNGILWRLYHVTFAEGDGISHDLAFEANLVDEVEKDPKALWARLGLLHRSAVKKGELESYWEHRRALAPGAVVRVLFKEDVLKFVRRELRRDAGVAPDLEDVFKAVRDALSNEALAQAGDLSIGSKRRRRKRPTAPPTSSPLTGGAKSLPPDAPEAHANDGPVASGDEARVP